MPGTVDLSAVEGEETHYGQALFPGELQSGYPRFLALYVCRAASNSRGKPVPSADPNDPLQVCLHPTEFATHMWKLHPLLTRLRSGQRLRRT